jgi:hypothetical protein
MLTLVNSTASDRNAKFSRADRLRNEDNIAWLQRQLADMGTPQLQLTHLVLLGGRGLTAFRLRVAQSHVRHDLLPSNWSHAMLLGELAASIEDTTIYELSLEPRGGFQKMPETNGLQTSTLAFYKRGKDFPNVALLRLPVPVAAWLTAPTAEGRIPPLDHFQRQRAILDAPAWLCPGSRSSGVSPTPAIHSCKASAYRRPR